MLYKDRLKKWDPEMFQNPGSEYRGAPFWAWSGTLDPKEIQDQIEVFQEMGFGGFHMHPRVGLETEYLGETFMECIQTAVKKAAQEGMLAYLYDDDRYPSGTCGGKVTRNPEYGAVYLMFSPKEHPYELVGIYDVDFLPDGKIRSYKKCEGRAEHTLIYAYCVPLTGRFTLHNDMPYVDTLNPEAIEDFVERTYPLYKDAVGEYYGKTIHTMFSDEAYIAQPAWYAYAQPFGGDHSTDISMFWSRKLPEAIQERYHLDIVECLPEILWGMEEPSFVKLAYFDTVSELFVTSFMKTCHDRCKEDGLLFTGHMNRENRLFEQTGTTGETMRAFRELDIPGVDILYNSVERNTLKEAQSVVHQYGREGMLSELYGISNWDFDFRGYKYQGDWQAACGVTLRVPHLSMMTMRGEAKRDYPASLGKQSPWYREFSCVEDHFARLNTALTRGKPVVKVAVIHPIETYWMHVGVDDENMYGRHRAEKIFEDMTCWLEDGLIDFDLLAESMIPDIYREGAFGEMRYDAVFVAGCETLRETTVTALKDFQKYGGRVVMFGDRPRYMDAKPWDYREFECRELSRECVVRAADPYRTVDMRYNIRALIRDGYRPENFVYTLREEPDCKWLFLASVKKMDCVDCNAPVDYRISVKGLYRPFLCDTLSGEIHEVEGVRKDGWTCLTMKLYGLSPVLLRLEKLEAVETAETAEEKVSGTRSEEKPTAETEEEMPGEMLEETAHARGNAGEENVPVYTHRLDFKELVTYCRREPNVLLLDRGEYRLDDGPWRAEEQVLRINNICRRALGWKECHAVINQPYAQKAEEKHLVTVRFAIDARTEIRDAHFVTEGASRIVLNGEQVPVCYDGYYVDKALHTIPLPVIPKGVNHLEVQMEITENVHVECCYLLGEFGVYTRGCRTIVCEPEEKIGFGDVTGQGMAFYGGSLRYRLPFCLPERGGTMYRTAVHCSAYRGAAVKVFVDGRDCGILAYPPYTTELGMLKAGEHVLELELLGNRFNTFGALHNMDSTNTWCSPYSWRTEGDAWSYEYQQRPFGILKSPEILWE